MGEITKVSGASIARILPTAARFEMADADVSPGSTLVSREACEVFLAETAHMMTPCGRSVAGGLVGPMLAVFTVAGAEAKGGPAAQEAYINAVVSVLADTSREIAEQAVVQVSKFHKFGKFPKPGDVADAVQKISAPINNARVIAQLHLREHERRAAKRLRNAPLAADGIDFDDYLRRCGL